MEKRAEKAKYPLQRIDYHQAAQLSALRALSLAFSNGSSSSFPLFAETFLEYVFQIFEADGAYLEFSSPENLRLSIGSCRGRQTGRKTLFSEAKKPALIHHARADFGSSALKAAGWDPDTLSLLATPIYWHKRRVGFLALGKSKVASFFKQEEIDELNLFTHYLTLAARKTSFKKTREEVIQEFSEHLEDGIYVIDRNGRAVVVNPKGKALLGVHDKEEAIRGLYSDPILLTVRSGDDAPLSTEQLPLALTLRGEAFSSVEYVIRRPGEKSDVHLSLSGGFLHDDKREVSEGILVAREVTADKRRERRLRTDLAVQKEKELARTAFLNHVSHELKTPLNVIVGYTSLLLTERYGPIPQRAKEALSRTHVNAMELGQMINDLLTLSKIAATKMPLLIEEVDLAALLNSVVKDAHPLGKEKPIRFVLKVDRDLPTIKSDRAKLKEIFLNLFSNAVKYTLKGSVRVIAKDLSEQRQVRIDVVDTGIGIREGDLSHLFEEFHRVEDPTIKFAVGTGLGLAIVKNMVGLLQGSVQVKSVYGKGSTFTVFLPYVLRSLP